MTRKMLCLVALAALLVVAASGCSNTPAESTTATQTVETTALGPPGQPITVVSVIDTYKQGQTVNPGGPSIEITLKNVSTEDVVSLAVALEERGRSFNFSFDVSLSHSLAPGRTISASQILIGGGWGDSIPYSVAVSGTLRSGESFSFTWEPKN